MKLTQLALLGLRILLVLLFLALVFLQVVSIPGSLWYMAEESPERAYLRWPLLALFDTQLLCVQVVIVCTWKLLAMVERDRIFSAESVRWVDGIVASIVVAWSLLAGLFLYVGLTADDPGLPVLLSVLVLVGAGLGLLMVVMRGLLRQATVLRTDMEAVI